MEDKLIKLNVFERITLQTLLPAKGDILTIKIVHDLHMNLSFSQEELDTYNIRFEKEGVVWNNILPQEKEILFGKRAFEISQQSIVQEFLKLNKENSLTQSHLQLLEKFIAFEEFMLMVEQKELEEKERMKNVVSLDKKRKEKNNKINGDK